MLSVEDIIAGVAAKYSISSEDIKGSSRKRDITVGRQEVMWRMNRQKILGNKPTWTLNRIGMYLGDRDHTTVMHGIRAHEARLKEQGIDLEQR
jgi:chromosomal replication initiator protein